MMHAIRHGARRGVLPILLLSFAAACGGEEEPAEAILRSVRYAIVSQGGESAERTFSGVVRAGTESRLSFQAAGRVVTLDVDVGDTVTEGQRIASIDPADVEIQIAEARASVASANAQARGASATYERTRALYESNSASRQDLDNARSQRDAARASASAGGQAIRRLQRLLEQTVLTAPAAGTISAVEVEANEVVSPGQAVARLQIGEQLVVSIDVPESNISDVERGADATITVDSLDGDAIEGQVFEVGAPTQNSAVFPVTVRLPDGVEGLRAGLAAEVSIAHGDQEADDIIHLPLSSVNEDGEGRYVFVATRDSGDESVGTVARRSVSVGDVDANGLHILEGVEEGELVVTAGVARIYDGMRVRIPSEPGALR